MNEPSQQHPSLALRKSPTQKRSRNTVATVLDATVLMLEQGGLAALNTNAIAQRAGVSIGSLYQYFPSKDSILAALIRRIKQEMLEDMQTALDAPQSGDIRQDARMFIKASLNHHRRYSKIIVHLDHAERTLPFDQETKALKAQIAQLVVTLLENCQIADAQEIAPDLIAICHTLSIEGGPSGAATVEEIELRMQRAVLGYIGYSAP